MLAQDFGSHNLCVLCFQDRAMAMMDAALALARDSAHPFSLAFALDHRSWLLVYEARAAEALVAAEADVRFASEQELPFFEAQGTIMRGWAMVQGGKDAAGLAEMDRGLALLEASKGVPATRPYWLMLRAWARGKGGCADQGLKALDEASALVRDQHLWDAEIHRLRGELI